MTSQRGRAKPQARSALGPGEKPGDTHWHRAVHKILISLCVGRPSGSLILEA